MSDQDTTTPSTGSPKASGGAYVVVARRYRPQTFEELVGQQHVSRSLMNAITANRVGHAYLFTGARGVGKTSAARILAKALNCVDGPTPHPCNQCDICESVRAGSDIDVLEIDGASNRGIDEIRDLRQNVGVRPSRATFKIYIIDEVHMLTGPAFNALLKTLEEPPAHVKFIFCTTEAEKIPVTILSRCQRFDFASIDTRAIGLRLQQIVATEGLAADAEALELLAMRSGGSMRDSQSLLEQLLSYGSDQITVDDVHRLLGTASDELLEQLVAHLSARDTAKTLALLDQSVNEGADVAKFLDQLFGHFRDLMIAASGCPAESFLYTGMSQREQTASAAKQLGVETILAIMQILEHTIARLRYSTQGRILVELALVRICQLENLDELADVIGRLQSGAALTTSTRASIPAKPKGPAKLTKTARTAAPAKTKETVQTTEPAGGQPEKLTLPPRASAGETGVSKPSSSTLTAEPASVAAAPQRQSRAESAQGDPQATIELSPETAEDVWGRMLTNLTGQLAEHASHVRRVASLAPNRLVLTFPATYTSSKTYCDREEQRETLEAALREVTGGVVRLKLEVEGGESETAATSQPSQAESPRTNVDVLKHPMVQRAMDLFDARPSRPIESGRDKPKR